MLTGVETAGVVLTVFPLCIELIKLYVSGTSTINEMRHHRRVLEQYQRELKLEYCKLSDSLFNLFEDTITGKECTEIFQDPNAAAERLKERLDGRPDVADNFISTMIAIKGELEELQETFLFQELQKDFSAAGIGGKRSNDGQPRVGSKEYAKLSKRAMKNLRKRFTLALLKDEHVERMKRIRNSNEDIGKLVHGALQCAANLKSNPTGILKKDISGVDKYYRRVREGAQSICDIIQRRIQIPHDGCESQGHSVSLCLEDRDVHIPAQKLRGVPRFMRAEEAYGKIRFKIAVCLGEPQSEAVRVWKELEMEPVLETEIEALHSKFENHPQALHSNVNAPSILIDPASHNTSERALEQFIAVGYAESSNMLTIGQATPLNPNSRPTTPSNCEQPNLFSNVLATGSIIMQKASRVLRRPKSRGVLFEGTPPQPDSMMQSQNFPSPDVNCRIIRQPQSSCSIRDTTSASSDADLHPIHDFCLTIKQSTTNLRSQCIGLLQCGSGSQIYHRVWSMPVGGCFDLGDRLQYCSRPWPADDEPIPLRVLLEGSTRGFAGARLLSSFPLKARLSLGITLASSVIQLHQTRWLRDFWNKQDIVFFIDPVTKTPLTRIPMVLQELDNCNKTPGSALAGQVGVSYRKDKVLFSLGLVLWELWFGEILEKTVPENTALVGAHSSDYREWSDTGLVVAADRALRDLQDNSPKLYSGVVQTCLYDNIPSGSEGFVATVWEKVVHPLQTNFLNY